MINGKFCLGTLSAMLALMFGAATGTAQLTLTLDTTAKTGVFSGSDGPVSPLFFSTGQGWSSAGGGLPGAVPADVVQLDAAGADAIAASAAPGTDAINLEYDGTNIWIAHRPSGNITTSNTYTPGPNSFSYSSFSTAGQTALEALQGSTLTPYNHNGGMNPLSIVGSAIPEPSSFSFLILITCIWVLARRIRAR